MADNKLIFKDAEEARDDITKRELKEIRKLYNQWARDIKSEYNSYKMSGGSDVQKMRELTQMYYRMRNASKQLSADINSRINIGINDMSNITVAVNKRWLSSLGIKDISKFDTRFSYAKNIAVRNIITGNLYSDLAFYDTSERNLKFLCATMDGRVDCIFLKVRYNEQDKNHYFKDKLLSFNINHLLQVIVLEMAVVCLLIYCNHRMI